MQANWSLILNVLLLVGVVITITLLMKTRRQNLNQGQRQSTPSQAEKTPSDTLYNDDIIAVRKVESSQPQSGQSHQIPTKSASPLKQAPSPQTRGKEGSYFEAEYEQSKPQLPKNNPLAPSLRTREDLAVKSEQPSKVEPITQGTSSLMLFLLAKENRQFAGYELLQTVLAAGLRFGEDQLFHRHQFSNGQGPILCSLAAATASGVFDLQNIGAFSARGLCLFMNTSRSLSIDKERFSIMLETARHLSEGLDALLLDDQQKPLTAAGVEEYLERLQSEESVA